MAVGFVEAIRRHSAELETLQGDQANEFLRLLRKLQEEIQGRLLSSEGPGSAITAFNLQRILAETKAGILKLEQKAQAQYGKASVEATDLAVEHIGDELDRLSLAFDAKPMEVTIDAAKALADPAQGLLANHFESSVQKYGIDLLNGVRQRLFVSLRTGDPMSKVVADIAGRNGPFGAVGKVNAERLVRTETSQAYGAAGHSALVQSARQVKGLAKTWLHVSSFICPTCIKLHGTQRPIDGTWTVQMGKRTRTVAHPPLHPSCGCRCSGMKKSWADALKGMGYLNQTEDSVL